MLSKTLLSSNSNSSEFFSTSSMSTIAYQLLRFLNVYLLNIIFNDLWYLRAAIKEYLWFEIHWVNVKLSWRHICIAYQLLLRFLNEKLFSICLTSFSTTYDNAPNPNIWRIKLDVSSSYFSCLLFEESVLFWVRSTKLMS